MNSYPIYFSIIHGENLEIYSNCRKTIDDLDIAEDLEDLRSFEFSPVLNIKIQNTEFTSYISTPGGDISIGKLADLYDLLMSVGKKYYYVSKKFREKQALFQEENQKTEHFRGLLARRVFLDKTCSLCESQYSLVNNKKIKLFNYIDRLPTKPDDHIVTWSPDRSECLILKSTLRKALLDKNLNLRILYDAYQNGHKYVYDEYFLDHVFNLRSKMDNNLPIKVDESQIRYADKIRNKVEDVLPFPNDLTHVEYQAIQWLTANAQYIPHGKFYEVWPRLLLSLGGFDPNSYDNVMRDSLSEIPGETPSNLKKHLGNIIFEHLMDSNGHIAHSKNKIVDSHGREWIKGYSGWIFFEDERELLKSDDDSVIDYNDLKEEYLLDSSGLVVAQLHLDESKFYVEFPGKTTKKVFTSEYLAKQYAEHKGLGIPLPLKNKKTKEPQEHIPGMFDNCFFVIQKDLEYYSWENLKNFIEDLGGKVYKKITPKVTHVIINNKDKSDYSGIQNITVLSEQVFQDMVNPMFDTTGQVIVDRMWRNPPESINVEAELDMV